MKKTCVRIRIINGGNCKIQNYDYFEELKNIKFSRQLEKIEKN